MTTEERENITKLYQLDDYLCFKISETEKEIKNLQRLLVRISKKKKETRKQISDIVNYEFNP
jgi:hypothetical protein